MKSPDQHGRTEQERAFIELPIYKVLVRFIGPAVLSQLVFLILNLTDAFFVGRTEDTYQISAMTIIFPFIMVMQFLATVFGVGSNANIAASLGRGDREKAKRYSCFALITVTVLVIIYSVIMLFIETKALRMFGANDNSIGHCKNYLLWVLHVGCILAVLVQTMSQLFMGEGRPKESAVGVAFAGILNIIFDPICIFLFHMGVAGAGLATCIGNYCALFYYFIILHRIGSNTVITGSLRYFQVGNGICKGVLAIGIPAGLGVLFTSLCDLTRNYYFGKLGTQVNLAAWGVVQKIGTAFIQICIGIGQGIRSVIAYNYATGLYKRTRIIVKAALLVMLCWTVFAVVFVQAVPDKLVGLFIPSGEAAPVAVVYLVKWIFAIFGIGFIEVFNSVFQGVGRWNIAMIDTIINKGLLLTPGMIILIHFLGMNGIVISQAVTENVTAAVLAFLYIAISRNKHSADRKEIQI